MENLVKEQAETDYSKYLVNQEDPRTIGRVNDAIKILSYRPNNRKLWLAHQDERITRAIFGGNRSGKTVFGAVEVIWWALGLHPYFTWIDEKWERPLQIRICCTSFTQGIQGVILPTLREWLPKDSYNYSKSDRIMELYDVDERGQKILLAQIEMCSYEMDLDKFGGVNRHLIWCDEEPPKPIWVENKMRTIGCRGHMLLTMTPIHGMTWVYSDIYLSDDVENIGVYTVRSDQNPHLPSDFIDQIRRELGDKEAEAVRLEGEFLPRSSFIYFKFDPEVHVVDPFEIWKDGVPPQDYMIVIGIDTHERTEQAAVFLAISPENVVYVYDEIFEHCLIHEFAQKIRHKLSGRRPAFSVIDTSASTESSISGLSIKQVLGSPPHNIHCLTTKKGRDSVQEGIAKVREWIDWRGHRDGKKLIITKKPRCYICKNCRETIREFRLYVWDDYRGILKDRYNPKEQPLKKHDHLLDSLRYVLNMPLTYRHPGLMRSAQDFVVSRNQKRGLVR